MNGAARGLRAHTRQLRALHPRMSAQSRPQTLATVAAADRLPEVVVLSGLQDLRSRLEATCGTRARFVDADDDAAALARARIMVADPSAFVQVAERCTRLEWMQSTWAGADALLKHSKRDYTVTRLAGCFGPRIAEYTLMHLLALERGLVQNAENQRHRVWGRTPDTVPYRTLQGRTMGVLGMGDIGSSVASAASALGMRVWGLRRSPVDAASSGVERMFTTDGLQEFLSGTEVLVNVAPSTAATRGLLGGGALAVCNGAVLVNAGRGDIIDEDSLLEALDRGWLSHAILDVFSVEPLPQESPLWTHPRVTITPHVAAMTFPEDVVGTFADNLERHLTGQPLRFQLDWEQGY